MIYIVKVGPASERKTLRTLIPGLDFSGAIYQGKNGEFAFGSIGHTLLCTVQVYPSSLPETTLLCHIYRGHMILHMKEDQCT